LSFPPERHGDLKRALTSAATELGLDTAEACATRLFSATLTEDQFHAVTSHLAVGETYFHREPRAFQALAEKVLPELIRQRRPNGQQLRIWSAACCTGEEAYSLAILLEELLPDRADWRIMLLGTDLNPRFLEKARTGI